MDLGVGEAIEAVKLVWFVYEQCKGAPDKIENAANAAKQIGTWLEILEKEVDICCKQERPSSEIKDMIKKSMKDLEEDLQRLHLLIKKWNDGLFGDRYLVFVWTDMSTVVEIRNTLKDHHEHNIRRNVDLLKMHLDNVRYKKDKEAAKKAELAKIEENKKQRADLIRDRLTRDKQHADLQKLLEALLRQSSGKLMLNAAASSDPQQWAAIENSYMTMKQDTSRIEAQRVLNPIKDELRRLSACASPKKIPILETKTSIQGQMEQADSLHLSKGDDKATKADLSKTGRDDGKKGDETAHDHAKKKKKKKDVLKQHAMENTSDSNSPKPVDASSSKNGPGNCTLGNVDSGTSCADSAGDLQIGAATSDQKAFKSKSRMLKTGKRTICVDASHGMQSILTQTYLEMIRAWTANASGDWLANRIQSAGYQVDTPFARLALAAGHLSGDLVKTDTTWRSALINAVNAVGSRKWPLTPDWPDEKAEILARMKERGRNGMKEDYFEDFDFILCFDIQAYATLRSLRAFAPEQRSASKVPLKGWIVRLDVPVSSTTTIPSLELLRALEGAVSGFLTKNLDWTAPKKGIAGGMYRTRQFTVPHDKKDIVRQKADEVRRLTGVKMIIISFGSIKGQLVSIVGPKERLKQAETLIKEVAS